MINILITLVIISALGWISLRWIAKVEFVERSKNTYVKKNTPNGIQYTYENECTVYCYDSRGMSRGVILSSVMNGMEVIPKVRFLSDYISLYNLKHLEK